MRSAEKYIYDPSYLGLSSELIGMSATTSLYPLSVDLWPWRYHYHKYLSYTIITQSKSKQYQWIARS